MRNQAVQATKNCRLQHTICFCKIFPFYKLNFFLNFKSYLRWTEKLLLSCALLHYFGKHVNTFAPFKWCSMFIPVEKEILTHLPCLRHQPCFCVLREFESLETSTACGNDLNSYPPWELPSHTSVLSTQKIFLNSLNPHFCTLHRMLNVRLWIL